MIITKLILDFIMSLHAIFKCLYINFLLVLNKLIKKKQCYICGQQFCFFKKYNGGFKRVNSFLLHLNVIGSDLDNFECMYCNSHDRERHLYMFFDKLNLWDKIKNSQILHFAPEKNLQNKILQFSPSKYVKADFAPMSEDIIFVDATNIKFNSYEFDIVIANHILEHIKDHEQALAEIYRVLKVGGMAILQTPYSSILTKNFEDNGIKTGELKTFFYGQEDHVRIFSENELQSCIRKAGFDLKVIKHSAYYGVKEANYYGVNDAESLFLAKKQ